MRLMLTLHGVPLLRVSGSARAPLISPVENRHIVCGIQIRLGEISAVGKSTKVSSGLLHSRVQSCSRTTSTSGSARACSTGTRACCGSTRTGGGSPNCRGTASLTICRNLAVWQALRIVYPHHKHQLVQPQMSLIGFRLTVILLTTYQGQVNQHPHIFIYGL